MLQLLRHFTLALVLSGAYPAMAECALSLNHGRSTVSGIPTERVNDKLTTKYTRVETSIESSSAVNEVGLECELGYGFAASASSMWGIHAAVERDVYFTGLSYRGVEIFHDTRLLHISERADARTIRVSIAKYFDIDWFSPYVRLGIERVDAKHHVSIPIAQYAITYEQKYSKTAPYAGLGIVLFRKKSVSVRCEYQLESIKPHQVSTTTCGVDLRFQF